MNVIPVFNFARVPGTTDQQRANAVQIARITLNAGATRGMAYMAGKRYLRNCLRRSNASLRGTITRMKRSAKGGAE